MVPIIFAFGPFILCALSHSESHLHFNPAPIRGEEFSGSALMTGDLKLQDPWIPARDMDTLSYIRSTVT